MGSDGSPIVGVIFLALCVTSGVWGVVWYRRILDRRRGALRDSLTRHGAKVLSFEPGRGVFAAATLRFELGGRLGRLMIGPWGRSTLRVTLQVDAPPRPGLWIRQPGRAFDGPSRALGLERTVALDGGSVTVATRASDATVQQLLAPPEARRLVHELVDASSFAAFIGIGHVLAIGPEGVSITRLTSVYESFDPTVVLPILERLAALERVLPQVGPAEITPLVGSRPPVLSALAPMLLLIPGLVGATLVTRHPLGTSVINTMLLVGMVPVPVAWFYAWRRYRGRPSAFRELFFTALGLLALVPFLTLEVLSAMNSALDSGPRATHRARVLDYYKHNSRTVYVEPWTPGVDREKVIVPRSIPRVTPGDTLVVTTGAGLFGWTWVQSVVKE